MATIKKTFHIPIMGLAYTMDMVKHIYANVLSGINSPDICRELQFYKAEINPIAFETYEVI